MMKKKHTTPGLHNTRPVKPFTAGFEKFTQKIGRKQFAIRLLQVPEKRKFQKFACFGKTNVQLVWKHLHTVCEQTFLLMNFNKSKQRSSLTERHLEDILKISCSSIKPDYAELVAGKRCNISY